MNFNSRNRTVLRRNPVTISAIFSIYHILHLLDKPTIHVYSEEKRDLICIDKNSSDIVNLEFDFGILEGDFYKWCINSKEPAWQLNKEQSKMLLKSIRIACHYFFLQQYKCLSENKIKDLVEFRDAVILEQIID
jgi:hypothetical protein